MGVGGSGVMFSWQLAVWIMLMWVAPMVLVVRSRNTGVAGKVMGAVATLLFSWAGTPVFWLGTRKLT